MSQPMQRTEPTQARYQPARRDPFSDFNRTIQQMAQLVEAQWPDLPSLLGRDGFTPLADVEETDDAYIVEMELPGAKSDDLSIDVSGNEVRVYGEIKQRERKGILRRQTRKVGEFDYHFSLPVDIDADEIKAELNDGVLTLRAPKLESAQPRRITVSGK
jgi:HSP20 family protein